MYDLMRMHILERPDDLDGVALDLDLVQTLPPPEQLVHRLVLAELQQNVHVLVVFEEMFKAHNMSVH